MCRPAADPRHTLLLVGVYYVLYTLNPQLLLNSGLTRPFTCIAPEGTVLNPSFPAAVGMRSLTCARLRSLIFGAFSLAAPGAPAGGAGRLVSSIVNVMTTDEKHASQRHRGDQPGGRRRRRHAASRRARTARAPTAAYLKNTPIEITETEVPIQFMRYGLLPDSGGAGHWRGGLATVMEFKVFAPNTRITVRNRDRSRFRPWGTLGGRAAETSNFIINPATPGERILGNADIAIAEPGDIIHIHSPGGGGRGCPTTRDPQHVLADVARGYVSTAHAEAAYGVIVRDGLLDVAATSARRAAMTLHPAHFHFGPERDAYETVWTSAAYDRLTAILSGLPIHWRFFVKTKLFAALRGMPGTPDIDAALMAVRQAFPQVPRPE